MAANNASAPTERARLSSLGGLVIVLASTVMSIISYGQLAETVRIRWTIGTYQHYGPEHVSTLFALMTFQVIITGLYIGTQWLRNYLERVGRIEDFDEFRTIYDIGVIVVLGIILGSQIVIIVLNL